MTQETISVLKKAIRKLPNKPGVYVMHNEFKQVHSICAHIYRNRNVVALRMHGDKISNSDVSTMRSIIIKFSNARGNECRDCHATDSRIGLAMTSRVRDSLGFLRRHEKTTCFTSKVCRLFTVEIFLARIYKAPSRYLPIVRHE